MNFSVSRLWQQNRFLVLFIVLMFAFRSAIADWNSVPTGSMQPTIVEGDRIFVNKMAYDIRVPFTHISLVKLADPQRGEIIVFDSEKSDKRLVKRVIGVPGDRISMRNNVLMVNGQTLGYQQLPESTSDFIENLLGIEHKVRINPNGYNRLSSFPTTVVPEDAYLALGDSRDNSVDSRAIGFIPRQEIIGRASSVVMSFNYDNYYIPRANRFFKSLDS